jgi:uncharacterized protein YbjT (DUF2867 family)
MRIAIVGGAGTLGKHITAELSRRGHEVRVLSRSSPAFPVDLSTGEGLETALAGCSTVVDASNSQRKARQVLVDGTRRLLAAEQRAGVGHHVGVSIVGCDQVPLGYYRVKTAQEHLVQGGPVPWTIVRATQFHELAASLFAASARYRVLPAGQLPMQPVAAAEVAGAIAAAAESQPADGRIQVAGPQVSSIADLARTWRSVTGKPAMLLPVPLPGKMGRELRAGALTARQADFVGAVTFADWLASADDVRNRHASSS